MLRIITWYTTYHFVQHSRPFYYHPSVEHHISAKPQLLFLTKTQVSAVAGSNPYYCFLLLSLSSFLWQRWMFRLCTQWHHLLSCFQSWFFSDFSTFWLRLNSFSKTQYISVVYSDMSSTIEKVSPKSSRENDHWSERKVRGSPLAKAILTIKTKILRV